jgi:hypothetical protein
MGVLLSNVRVVVPVSGPCYILCEEGVPLAEDDEEFPVCATSECCPANANPTMFITLTWTDPDITKFWIACDWFNGETKEISGVYEFFPWDAIYCEDADSQTEGWAACEGPINSSHAGRCTGHIFSVWTENEAMSGCVTRIVNIAIAGNEAEIGQCIDATTSLYCDLSSTVVSYTPADFNNGPEVNNPCQDDCVGDPPGCPGGFLANGYIDNRLTDGFHLVGSITFTDGITVSWAQGNGW